MNAAAYAGGVNSKTPAMLVESKITDSQTKEVIGEGLVTIQGESFRTGGGSVESFVGMAKKVVRVALETSADPRSTAP
jgi:GMP synthase PP-ATPase subunit